MQSSCHKWEWVNGRAGRWVGQWPRSQRRGARAYSGIAAMPALSPGATPGSHQPARAPGATSRCPLALGTARGAASPGGDRGHRGDTGGTSGGPSGCGSGCPDPPAVPALQLSLGCPQGPRRASAALLLSLPFRWEQDHPGSGSMAQGLSVCFPCSWDGAEHPLWASPWARHGKPAACHEFLCLLWWKFQPSWYGDNLVSMTQLLPRQYFLWS